MPCLCWELLFSMLCMDKGSSLNLDLMNTSNCIVILIMLICVCVCDMVVWGHSYGRMIILRR